MKIPIILMIALIIAMLPSAYSQEILYPNATSSSDVSMFTDIHISNCEKPSLYNNEMHCISTTSGSNEVHIGYYGNGTGNYYPRSSINISEYAELTPSNKALVYNGTNFIFSTNLESNKWIIFDSTGAFIENITTDGVGCSDLLEHTLSSDGNSEMIYAGCSFPANEVVAYLHNGSYLGSNFTSPVNIFSVHWSYSFQRWYIGTPDNDTIYEFYANGTNTGKEMALDSVEGDTELITGITDDGNYLYVSQASPEEIFILEQPDLSRIDGIPTVKGGVAMDVSILGDRRYFITDQFSNNNIWEMNESGSITGRAFSLMKDNLTFTRGLADDGTYLYVSDDNTNSVYQYHTNGTLVNIYSISSGGSLRGIDRDHDTGNFWMKDEDNTITEYTSSFAKTGIIANVSVQNPNAGIIGNMVYNGLVYALGITALSAYVYNTSGDFQDIVINLTGNQLITYGLDTNGSYVIVNEPDFTFTTPHKNVEYPFSEWILAAEANTTIPTPTVPSIRCDTGSGLQTSCTAQEGDILSEIEGTCSYSFNTTFSIRNETDNSLMEAGTLTNLTLDTWTASVSHMLNAGKDINISISCSNTEGSTQDDHLFTVSSIPPPAVSETENFQNMWMNVLAVLVGLIITLILLAALVFFAVSKFGELRGMK